MLLQQFSAYSECFETSHRAGLCPTGSGRTGRTKRPRLSVATGAGGVKPKLELRDILQENYHEQVYGFDELKVESKQLVNNRSTQKETVSDWRIEPKHKINSLCL